MTLRRTASVIGDYFYKRQKSENAELSLVDSLLEVTGAIIVKQDEQDDKKLT